jgi:hypothetical protein
MTAAALLPSQTVKKGISRNFRLLKDCQSEERASRDINARKSSLFTEEVGGDPSCAYKRCIVKCTM